MPKKPDYLTFYLAKHAEPDWDYYVLINYHQSLESIMNMLKTRTDFQEKVPERIYNRFGQEIPFSYQIPTDNMTFYLDKPSADKLADLDSLLSSAEKPSLEETELVNKNDGSTGSDVDCSSDYATGSDDSEPDCDTNDS